MTRINQVATVTAVAVGWQVITLAVYGNMLRRVAARKLARICAKDEP